MNGSGMNESLIEKLRSLGVQVGARAVPQPPQQKEHQPIEDILPLDRLETPFGQTLVLREVFDDQYQHGKLHLAQACSLDTLSDWARLNRINKQKTLFLDTETSGLAGGTGTFAFMVGLGWWNDDQFVVQQFFMRDPGVEPALLAGLSTILSPFDTIVTYNGKSFDVPLLNARYVLNGISSPLPEMQHVDLLQLSRQIWRNRLSDRSLGNIEREVLGFRRGEEEIPGWMVPELYYDYLRTGNAAPLSGVFYHNKIDILSLAGLFVHDSLLLSEPDVWAAGEGLDIIGLARIFERMGNINQAIRLYEIGLESGLPRQFFVQTLYRFAELSKRNLAWDSARILWAKAVDYGEVDAAVELAKYYEHQARDYDSAIYWTEAAQTNLDQLLLPAYLLRQKQEELTKRKNRLNRKVSGRTKGENNGE